MKQEFKNAAAPAISATARQVLRELNSGYGDASSSLKAYKEIAGLRLFATTVDALKEEVYGLIEVESSQQSLGGEHNARTRTDFRVTAEDAALLAKTAPQEFREQLQRVANNLVQAVEKNFPGRDARRARENLKKIEEMARHTRRPLPAPHPATFAKKKGPLK